jgi:hypothetical protein
MDFSPDYKSDYGQIWFYDSDKVMYYRMENNKKCYYDELEQNDPDTCYATYLAKDNKIEHVRIMACIFDGDHRSLHKCLSVISDEDLWKVSEDDIKKVGPDRLKLILRKFHVQGCQMMDSKYNIYLEPESFEHWKIKIQKEYSYAPDLVKTIFGNIHLLKYIQAAITICKANPIILNNPMVQIYDTKTV